MKILMTVLNLKLLYYVYSQQENYEWIPFGVFNTKQNEKGYEIILVGQSCYIALP